VPDYETLRLIWWLLLGVLLIGFAVMDGFDLGVGATFRFVGRTDDERRALLESIEPVWEGNQVWFILGGGAVPALLFGVAFGNLFLGLPFHYDELQRPVFTGSFFTLLHPFALLAGVVSLAMLIMHGNAYAALKVGEPMSQRAAAVGRAAVVVFVVAFIIGGIWVARLEGARIVAGADPFGPSNPLNKQVLLVPGAWLANYRDHALLWLLPLLGIAGAVANWFWLGAQRAGSAFLASCVSVAATILTAGVALFPFLMPSSTHPAHGLTIWDASSSAYTLGVMLAAVAILLPAVIAYTAWVFHVMRGRITLEEIRRHTGFY